MRGEVEALQKISRQTFSDTFAEANTADNMAKYLGETFAAGRLSAELHDPQSAFYFAMHGKEPVGYIKLNSGAAQTELKDDTAVEIERIYVVKAFLGKKVGQLLLEHAIRFALQNNAAYTWLGVWEENRRAISFYQRNGFVAFGKHSFMLGDDEQTDIMMKRSLEDHL